MSRFVKVPIDEIRDETPDAYTIFFQKPDDPSFTYLPGQHLTIKVELEGESLRRAFSLSSSPVWDDRLSITIKRVEGGKVSNHFRDHFQVGNLVEIMPPMGHFTVETDPLARNHYVLIGGGSGITPLMSILKTVLKSEGQSKVSLWYCNRDEDSIIFLEELAALSKEYPDRLHVHHSLTRPSKQWKGAVGRLDRHAIYDLVSELFMSDELRKQYYLCGPDGLMREAEKALEEHAVYPADIFRELYSAPAPTEAQVAAAYAPSANGNGDLPTVSDGEATYTLEPRKVRVILDGRETEIPVDSKQVVLDAAIAADLDPPYACQSGICTTCRAMLLSGVVAMDETEGLSTSELEDGFVLTCQCHPLSEDVELEYR